MRQSLNLSLLLIIINYLQLKLISVPYSFQGTIFVYSAVDDLIVWLAVRFVKSINFNIINEIR